MGSSALERPVLDSPGPQLCDCVVAGRAVTAIRSAEGPQVTVFAFDVLALDGADLRNQPQYERRAVLERTVRPGDPVLRLVHSYQGDPAAMVESVDELGLEGVVAKWVGTRYVGGRSPLWRKLVLRRPDRGWRVEGGSRRACRG